MDVNVAASASTGEQYASSVFKATVKYVQAKYQQHANTSTVKLFVKLVIPKVNAFTDENTFDTGEACDVLSYFGNSLIFKFLNSSRAQHVFEDASGYGATAELERRES